MTTTSRARVGAYLSPRDSLAGATGLVRRAEDLGYDSVWVTHGVGRDAFLVLAAYASQTARIGLGTGVVPIYPRHPVLMAQEAATLSELSAGRLRLGIGVSHRSAMADARCSRSFFDFGDMARANAGGYFPYTPALPMLYGLRESLDMISEQGLDTIFARHHRLAEGVRAAVRGDGAGVRGHGVRRRRRVGATWAEVFGGARRGANGSICDRK